jgi:hypothetical protein
MSLPDVSFKYFVDGWCDGENVHPQASAEVPVHMLIIEIIRSSKTEMERTYA